MSLTKVLDGITNFINQSVTTLTASASVSTPTIKSAAASTAPVIQDSVGTEIGQFCRAWVNFNGTGTVAIRDSFNVSSITDNGTGSWDVNFTVAMPSVNYAGVGSQNAGNNTLQMINNNANYGRINSYVATTGALFDASVITATFFIN